MMIFANLIKSLAPKRTEGPEPRLLYATGGTQCVSAMTNAQLKTETSAIETLTGDIKQQMTDSLRLMDRFSKATKNHLDTMSKHIVFIRNME